MLLAKTKNGSIVSLFDATERQLAFYKTCAFYCPCCNGKLHVKAGKIKIPHFAHAINEACDYASEGESEEHLEGKRSLYDWFRKQGMAVVLEKYIPQIKQRPDLYLECREANYAIEFQCSALPLDVIKKRTLTYRKANIIPLWIFSYSHLKRHGNAYSLSAFQWYGISGSSLAPRIVFYSPKLQEFTILNQLTPFSSRQIFGFPLIRKQKHLSFLQLAEPDELRELSCRDWMARKKRWRLTSFVHAGESDLHISLYQAGISPATLPDGIGLPVPYMHLYETPCIEWQSWLYLYILRGKKEGDMILRKNIQAAVIRCIQENKIRLRFLPLQGAIDPILPAKWYMSLLDGIGLVEEAGGGNFRLIKTLQMHNPALPKAEEIFCRKACSVYNKLMKREQEA